MAVLVTHSSSGSGPMHRRKSSHFLSLWGTLVCAVPRMREPAHGASWADCLPMICARHLRSRMSSCTSSMVEQSLSHHFPILLILDALKASSRVERSTTNSPARPLVISQACRGTGLSLFTCPSCRVFRITLLRRLQLPLP